MGCQVTWWWRHPLVTHTGWMMISNICSTGHNNIIHKRDGVCLLSMPWLFFAPAPVQVIANNSARSTIVREDSYRYQRGSSSEAVISYPSSFLSNLLYIVGIHTRTWAMIFLLLTLFPSQDQQNNLKCVKNLIVIYFNGFSFWVIVVTLMNSCVTMLHFVQLTIQLIVRSKNWNMRDFDIIINVGISAATIFLPRLMRKRLRFSRGSKTLLRR